MPCNVGSDVSDDVGTWPNSELTAYVLTNPVARSFTYRVSVFTAFPGCVNLNRPSITVESVVTLKYDGVICNSDEFVALVEEITTPSRPTPTHVAESLSLSACK